MRARTDLWEPQASNPSGHLAFDHFRPTRLAPLYPAALPIIDQGVASEREVCQFLSISRSQFQNWKQFESTARDESDARLLPLITSIFHRHRRRYGSRRIVEELKSMNHPCGRQRVSKLMKMAGLSAIQPKSFKPRSTESRHTLGYSANLLLELPEPSQPHRLWVGDITYIPVSEIGFGYLAMLMDPVYPSYCWLVFSRRHD